jgi:hypothetical protein
MHVGDQEGRVGIPLTSLTLPYFCACPEPGQGFPMSYVMGFFVFRELWWEVIICFADIGGIVDHHWLKPPRYNWNIAGSGVKHHKTNTQNLLKLSFYNAIHKVDQSTF